MSIIFHLDMDSYFASCEQQAHPPLRGKPIGILGKLQKRTIIAAASREAKKWGVKSGMAIFQVKKLCPEIILVPGNVDCYQNITERFIKILEKYTPLIEIFSIDEVFMDVTDTATRFGGAIKIIQEIKEKMRKELGEFITCSIGIAPNKFLAKIASDKNKPDGLTIITPKDIPRLLAVTPIEEACGIGPRLTFRLNQLGIKTLAELGGYPLKNLIALFGKCLGSNLHQMGKGIDHSPVISCFQESPPKSFGHSVTLPFNTQDSQVILAVILKLSEKIGRRMRKSGFSGKTISLSLVNSESQIFHKQKTFSSLTYDGYKIYVHAKKIYQNINRHGFIRLVGVSVSNLQPYCDQKKIFKDQEKREKALFAFDQINDRFGEFTIKRAPLLDIENIERGTDGFGRLRDFSF